MDPQQAGRTLSGMSLDENRALRELSSSMGEKAIFRQVSLPPAKPTHGGTKQEACHSV